MDTNQLTPQQQQAVMVQAQNEANQQIMQQIMVLDAREVGSRKGRAWTDLVTPSSS